MDKQALLAVTKGDLQKLQQRLDEGIDIDAQDDSGRTLLHHATSNGHCKILQYLLKHGADVLLTTNKHNTALHIAAIKDSMATATILENVARSKLRKLLDAKTKASGNTALHAAAKLDDDPIQVIVLMTFGANFEICNDAGEMPIDLTDRRKSDSTLFGLIGAAFACARAGDARPVNDKISSDTLVIGPLTGSRNNEGRTLIQEYMLNGHVKLASELLHLRDRHPIFEHLGILLLEPSRKREVDALVEGARKFREFWSKQKAALTPLLASIRKAEESSAKELERRAVKMCCAGLKKAHEVLQAYYEFQGEQMSMTIDFRMRSLEEVIEALGFDPQERYDNASRDDCYYEKLSIKWKNDVRLFALLMDCLIYESNDCHVRNLTTAQLFHAVKEDDLERVQRLLDGDAPIDVCDHTGRTELCYAAENGNRKIVKLLLKSGAKIIHELALLPFTLAAEKGHTKMIKLLLKKTDPSLLATHINWYPEDNDNTYTALHAAAIKGHFPIVKTLLKYGANYRAVDKEGRTPLDVSTNEEVTEFLRLVDSCFDDAKEAKAELAHKLKAMPTDDFLAVASTKNRGGQTLAVVATKAKAKNIAGLILRMIRETKVEEK